MSLSVVIPTKDRLRSLERVLPSYLAQPEVDEVVFVIDGSSDDTAGFLSRLAEREPRIRWIDNGRNRGIPYSKNVGIEAATSDLVFLGEDDVELSPGFFATLLEHRTTSGADVIAGRNIWPHKNETIEAAMARSDQLPGPAIDRRRIAINGGVRIEDDREQPLLPNPMLAPRSLFLAIRFDERYEVHAWREETDFRISAREAGYTLVSCPHAVSFNGTMEDDRGGVHQTVGLRRLYWITVNNWRFVLKHRPFLLEEFGLERPALHVASTTARIGWREFVLPVLVRWKRRVRRWPESLRG